MNIGFDLDKILIYNPPLIPSWLIAKLYGEKVNGHLSYRFPGIIEQYIRKLSHIPFLRPAIKENIHFLQQEAEKKQHKLFLVSSRYGFLKKETETIIEKYKLQNIFLHMYFNFDNKQPHLFKSEVIHTLHLQKFVDDDLPLIYFLSKKYPKVIFYWLNPKENKQLGKNIFAISHLADVFL